MYYFFQCPFIFIKTLCSSWIYCYQYINYVYIVIGSSQNDFRINTGYQTFRSLKFFLCSVSKYFRNKHLLFYARTVTFLRKIIIFIVKTIHLQKTDECRFHRNFENNLTITIFFLFWLSEGPFFLYFNQWFPNPSALCIDI